MSGQVFNEDYRIPDKLVGLVIGRGGESIKRLQMESGCKIRIAPDSEGSQDGSRGCVLSGSQGSIDEAKRMLDDVIRRGLNRETRNGGNGNGNGGGGAPRAFNNGGAGGYQQRRFFNNNSYQNNQY